MNIRSRESSKGTSIEKSAKLISWKSSSQLNCWNKSILVDTDDDDDDNDDDDEWGIGPLNEEL